MFLLSSLAVIFQFMAAGASGMTGHSALCHVVVGFENDRETAAHQRHLTAGDTVLVLTIKLIIATEKPVQVSHSEKI